VIVEGIAQSVPELCSGADAVNEAHLKHTL